MKIKNQKPKIKTTIQKSKIVSNIKVKENYFKLIMIAPLIAKYAQPGQFVNVKVNERAEPLLRRPLGIHRVNASNIEILYEVVGKGTKMLSQRKAGEYLDIIGPLGNGFNYRLPITDYRLPILVAGGMGVAPLVFLAEKLKSHKPMVLIGAKTKNQILCSDEFRKLGCTVRIATDNGSVGFKGRVTNLLKHLLSTIDYRLSTIYACGPRPMLLEISRISQEYHIPAQVSLEEHLACGIGACLGCVVNTRRGNQRVCKEGPVFDAEEIIWR